MDLYHSIPQYPDEISGTTTLIRLLDGLGFRLRWSTENLRETDYSFKPRDDCMSIEELESEAMKLDPKARARLAGKLLESLDTLSDAENEQLWAEEAERRNRDLDSGQDAGRGADEVLRDARDRLR